MAIVRHPVVAVRLTPDSRAELFTQEIFGKQVLVRSARGDWARCVLSDGSEGWVPLRALCRRDSYGATHRVIKRFAPLRIDGDTDLILSMGSLIEVGRKSGQDWTVRTPDGRSGTVPADCVRRLTGGKSQFKGLGRLIRQVIGTPYLWGGKSTFGFDCSGLVQFIFEFLGLSLPRDSDQQAQVGRLVRTLGRLRPLDLVFFQSKGKVNHVAIHMGNMDILHASGYVRIESLEPSSTVSREDLRASFCWARRVV